MHGKAALRHSEQSEAAVDPNRFDTSGQWITPPEYFIEDTEDRVIAGRCRRESVRRSRTFPKVSAKS